MKVLVTGAAGFIGSNLVHLLLKERPDWNVVALDSLTYAGNMENLAACKDNPKFSFLKIDITDTDTVAKAFSDEKFDLVFHLAAESHVDRSNFGALPFVKTNVIGTVNLLSATMANNVERFVHISTDEVYGSLESGSFSETTPLNPTNPYAASKASSDLMVLSHFKTHKLNAVITRCTNNYGPYQFPEKFIPLFITNALEDKDLPLYGDGMNVRSWIHVLDHCRALLTVAEKGRAGEVYNVGGFADGELPNKEVALRILKQLGKPESLIKKVADRPAHDRRYSVDSTKLRTELGWEPIVPMEKGLAETVNWYVENKTWWERIRSGEYLKFYALNYSNRG